MFVVASGLFAPGCAAPNRPDPCAAFNKIADHALKPHTTFDKQHVHPTLLEAETGPGKDASPDDFYEQFTDELQRYQALSWKQGDTDEKVVVEAAGLSILYPGTTWQFRMDMIYDRKHGWRISSRAYDRRPVGAPAEMPDDPQ
ncbi:MAG: hypothetical protein O7F76_13035 [Planctomycetota bacterium]|nr:hypothetical protein [Planctomycetota bacterium]